MICIYTLDVPNCIKMITSSDFLPASYSAASQPVCQPACQPAIAVLPVHQPANQPASH